MTDSCLSDPSASREGVRAPPTTTEHTPGPWQRSGVRHKLGNEDCIAVGPDGLALAFLPIGRRPHEQAGAIADANLIAAAPDLLAALEDIEERLRACSKDPISAAEAFDSFYQEIVETALAKARGR